MNPAQPQAAEHRALCAALLDFQRTPGRYPVALREPRAVFDHLHAVLTLAAGRRVDGLNGDANLESQVRQAARFFVRSVMLRPGADHYTLLGVAPGCAAQVLRDHYRLMIRLAHPDFLASGEAWPADAAARINIANDVLSSPEKRQAYHAARMTAPHPDPAAALARSLTSPGALPRRVQTAPPGARSQGRPGTGRRGPAGLGRYASAGLAVFALLGGLLMWPPAEDDSVTVARQEANRPAAPPANPVPAELGAPAEWGAPSAAAPEPPEAVTALPSPPTAAKPPTRRAKAEAGGETVAVAVTEAEADIEAGPVLTLSMALARPELVAARPAEPHAPQTQTQTQAQARATGAGQLALKTAAAEGRPVAPAAAEREAVLLPPAPARATEAGEAPGRAVRPATDSPGGPVIHMGQVQPVLSNVTQSLQSGRGEEVLQWLDRSSRNDEFAAQFAHRYHQALAGARVTGLEQVRFTPRWAAGQLVVDGVVQLRLQDGQQPARLKDFHLRAYFRSQGSGPVLARLVAE